MIEINRDFTFEAAHRLPNVPTGHKCARLHGHSYRVTISVCGPIDPDYGWVTDFGAIKTVAEPVVAQLDHFYLNDIDGLTNPTSEILAMWIWARLDLPGLCSVTVRETCTSACTYRGRGSL